MSGGQELQMRLATIMHLAPHLSLTAKSELLNCPKEEFDKWAESKGAYIARPHKENPLLRGKQLPPLRDWDMEEMNTLYADLFEELKSMREKI